MGEDRTVEQTNSWLTGSAIVALFALAIIMLAPKVIGLTMGTSGDGLGQFFAFLMVGGFAVTVMVVCCLALLLLSLTAWVR